MTNNILPPTSQEVRGGLGVGSVVHVRHEKGRETKDPTESAVMRKLGDWQPPSRKTPKDFYEEREKRMKEERESAAKEALHKATANSSPEG